MNTNWRRIILWALNAVGAFVGAWALAAPRSFYDAFPAPGLFGAWVGVDGPYNEHLVRDVGSLYLALFAAGVVAALMRRADASIAVGVAWLVFSVPHLVYHLAHLHGFDPFDAIVQPISLATAIVLAIPLCLPPRRSTVAGGGTETGGGTVAGAGTGTGGGTAGAGTVPGGERAR